MSGEAVELLAGPRVLVVGSGWRFTSGISYYTCRLTNALATVTPTSALLMRQLVPTRLYPGRARVGASVNEIDYAAGIPVLDGVDWHWGPSMAAARRFLEEQAPDVLVLQWWTGAVLHSYLRLAALARRRGARVVIEWHEVQDTGEAKVPGVVRYVRLAMRRLLGLADAHVVHSSYDLGLLREAYGLDPATVTIVAHGPYDHVTTAAGPARVETSPLVSDALRAPTPPTPDDPFRILYFGIIRPYKGVEDLVAAFSSLPDEQRATMQLVLVGETWEGWTAPLEAVAASPAHDRITVVNRYVSDAEARAFFASADAVALPYHRSSSSGPLHMAMSAGLPVVVSSVGGLVEAAQDYAGAVYVPPRDPAALAAALTRVSAWRGRRFEDPHSWDATTAAYGRIVESLGLPSWRTVAPFGGQSGEQTSVR